MTKPSAERTVHGLMKGARSIAAELVAVAGEKQKYLPHQIAIAWVKNKVNISFLW